MIAVAPMMMFSAATTIGQVRRGSRNTYASRGAAQATAVVTAALKISEMPYSLRKSSRGTSVQRTMAAPRPSSAIALAMVQTTDALAINP